MHLRSARREVAGSDVYSGTTATANQIPRRSGLKQMAMLDGTLPPSTTPPTATRSSCRRWRWWLSKCKCEPKTRVFYPKQVLNFMVFLKLSSVIVAVILISSPRETQAVSSDANRLYEDLMMSYNRFVRPVQNDTDTLQVKLGLRLSQLIDVVSF